MSVRVPLGGVAAQLNIASSAAIEQRMKAKKMRGLKAPDSEEEFFRIGFVWFGQPVRDGGSQTLRDHAGRLLGPYRVFESRLSDWMFILSKMTTM